MLSRKRLDFVLLALAKMFQNFNLCVVAVSGLLNFPLVVRNITTHYITFLLFFQIATPFFKNNYRKRLYALG